MVSALLMSFSVPEYRDPRRLSADLQRAVAGRIERSWLSGPIVFTAAACCSGRSGRVCAPQPQCRWVAHAGRIDARDGAVYRRRQCRSRHRQAQHRDCREAVVDRATIDDRSWLSRPPWFCFPGSVRSKWRCSLTDAAFGKPVVTNPAVCARRSTSSAGSMTASASRLSYCYWGSRSAISTRPRSGPDVIFTRSDQGGQA